MGLHHFSHLLSLDYFPGNCTALHNQESTLLSELYRVHILVMGYVNVFREMTTDGGQMTVANLTYLSYFAFFFIHFH